MAEEDWAVEAKAETFVIWGAQLQRSRALFLSDGTKNR